jgi:hypothetical protein
MAMTATSKRAWLALIFFMASLWLGLLLGVSFLAAIAKFSAPSSTLPVALDVGRHTFAIFNKVEIVLAAVMLLVVLATARTRLAAIATLLAALYVAFESAWLLPLLDERAGIVIVGQQPPPASYHEIFVYLQYAKLLAIAAVAFVMAQRLVQSSAPSPGNATAKPVE